MKKVVIVDDSMYMRSLISSALTETGKYEVVGQADKGNQAIETILELNPDLITMDNVLPDMLGIDVIKELRIENVNAKIIMISAVGQDSVIEEAYNAGTDSYLIKPFSVDTLIEQIDKLF